MFDLKYFLAVWGIGIIVILFLAVIAILVYTMLEKKVSKPVVDYPRLVRDDVYHAFIDLTNKDNIKHGSSPLTNNEKFQTRVSMGIASFVYAKYAAAIKKARAAGADIIFYLHKMAGEFAGIAQGMKISAGIISNVNNNYLYELSKPNMTPELMIKKWEASN